MINLAPVDESNYVAQFDDDTVISVGSRMGPSHSHGNIHIPGVVSPYFRLAAHDSLYPGQHYIDITPLIDAELETFANNNVVQMGNADIQFNFNTAPTGTQYNEYGALDMGLILNSEPDTNILTMAYDSSHVTLFLQPALDAELDQNGDLVYFVGKVLEDGVTTVASVSPTDVIDSNGNTICHRPPWVVGSLVVWADDMGGMVTPTQVGAHVTTGKIGSFYAYPLVDSPNPVYDPLEWATWGNDDSNLYLTFPQDTLDNADYPLSITPVGDTFGYTNTGASLASVGANYLYTLVITYAPPSSGTGVSMTVAGKNQPFENVNIQMAAYTVTGTLAGTEVTNGSTPSVSINESNTIQTWTSNFASGPSFSSLSTYYLCFNNDGNGGSYPPYLAYDTVASTGIYAYKAQTFGTWPSSFSGLTGPYSNTHQYTNYVTYTPGGGGTVVSKTATALARIQVNIAKTLTSKARIQAVLSKTQTSKARIKVTYSNSVTSKARIQAIILKTATALARIRVNIAKSSTAKARISVSYSKTELSKARIQTIILKTSTAVSRIKVIFSKTETSKARIQVVYSKSETTKARIRANILKSATAKAYIAVIGIITKSLTSKARIQVIQTKTSLIKARLSINVIKGCTAKAYISASAIFRKSTLAKARLSVVNSKSATAKASIFIITAWPIKAILPSRTANATLPSREANSNLPSRQINGDIERP